MWCECPKTDESGYGPLIAELNGQTAKIPAWWYLVHSLSKGVTHAAISSIPCGNDFRLLRFEVQHTKLIDPIIRQEVQEFASQCYAKSYYKLKNVNTSLPAKTVDSVNWIGSDYFLNTGGYYDYYTSTMPGLPGRIAKGVTVVIPRWPWRLSNRVQSGGAHRVKG
jgi:hypothetical protein